MLFALDRKRDGNDIFGDHSLKQSQSTDTTFDPLLFPVDNTFNLII